MTIEFSFINGKVLMMECTPQYKCGFNDIQEHILGIIKNNLENNYDIIVGNNIKSWTVTLHLQSLDNALPDIIALVRKYGCEVSFC